MSRARVLHQVKYTKTQPTLDFILISAGLELHMAAPLFKSSCKSLCYTIQHDIGLKIVPEDAQFFLPSYTAPCDSTAARHRGATPLVNYTFDAFGHDTVGER